MKTGETLANLHRPVVWGDVCGQTKAVARLKGILKSRQLPSSFLFSGVSGVGKTTLARVFSRYLNCETNEGCGECPSCVAMDARRHPDYIEINCADTRGIDEMRKALELASFSPQLGEIRVIVFDEFQQATPQAMQTALKTLEEPPPSTLFIICTMEVEKVHPAVIGRCQHLALDRVLPEYVADHLEALAKRNKIKLDRSVLDLIAESTGGQVRNAIQTLDAVRQAILGCDDEEDLEDLIRATVLQSSGTTDELTALSVVSLLHTLKDEDGITLRRVLSSVGKVENAVSFANSLLYLNSYLLDCACDPTNPKIFHTALNKRLVSELNAKATRKRSYGSKPDLGSCLVLNSAFLQLRLDLVTISQQDKALMYKHLSEAFEKSYDIYANK